MTAGRARFKGAIFDLDGLLIDSEPVWRWAQTLVLGEAGGLLTESMLSETTGLGLDEALARWKAWFPAAVLEKEAIGRRLQELALGRIARDARSKAGARRAVETCREAGCSLAVASSSSPLFIRTAVAALGLDRHFEALVSAQEVERGKPHPEVYLAAASRLGLGPEDCLAFEDSLHGMRAAKAAGMFCVAVPAARSEPGFEIADLVLDSLEDFLPHMLAARPPSGGASGPERPG